MTVKQIKGKFRVCMMASELGVIRHMTESHCFTSMERARIFQTKINKSTSNLSLEEKQKIPYFVIAANPVDVKL